VSYKQENILKKAVIQLSQNPIQKGSLEELLDFQEEIRLSFLFDEMRIQDSYTFRIQRRAGRIANYLVDEKGKLDTQKLEQVISLFEKDKYLFSPQGFCDGAFSAHVLFVLKKFKNDSAFYRFFQKFQGPLCHRWAEELVLASICRFDVIIPTEAHIKRAVLSACLSLLRQNVGSCFATAPAILIQQEQPERLLEDLYELLMTGKLKRTFLGIESGVPLSPSSGGGDLYRKIVYRENLSLYPGFQTAFSFLNLSEKKLQTLFATVFQKKKSLQVIELIHEVFLLHYDLNEGDLEQYRESTKTFLKSQEFLSGVKRGGSSKRMSLCEELLSLERKARAAFKAETDHALLKTWEFTIASFSEIKMQFSRFNLYSSLGMHSEEKGGIGEVIYQALQKQLDVDQEKLKEYDVEYQTAYGQVRAAEALLKNAGNESDARRLQAELASRVYHMRACLEMRDTLYANASHYSTFFSELLSEYDAQFPEYFQEIYDADLHDVSYQEYEDSPAGFRLVYKHGRSNPFLWTMIYGAEGYVDALVDFFLLVEPQIAAKFSWDLAPQILSEITTLITTHIRTPLFLDSALARMVKIHGQRGEMGTPWAYVSGGSMSILLQTYYKRETPVTEESKKVESPTDLLIFLLDTLKEIPLTSENKKLLTSSPSHAFTVIPSLEFLRSGWQDDLYTYTWVRDKMILPRKQFYESILLSPSEQSFLLEELGKGLPIEISHALHRVPCVQESSLISFRNEILEIFPRIPIEDKIDSFLYEMIPLVSGLKWKHLVKDLLSGLDVPHLEKVLDSYPDYLAEIMSAKEVREIAKAVYLLSKGSLITSFDLHEMICKKAEEMGLSPPAPLLFADTNWSQFYFGFVINPGTLQLELWRLQPSSGAAFPMSAWNKWFTEETTASWNICVRPFEYS
jgi:hypothetical protein